nr:MBL fold metallo-hydrolase [Pseudomonas izuensis]
MPRRLTSLNGAPRKLDGGVLFGSTPRRIWEQWMAPDHEHLVELPSRALLVQEPGRNILVLAGSELLLAPLPRTCNWQPRQSGLLNSLGRLGLGENDIDLVLLTHLHASPSPQQCRVIDAGQLLRVLFPRARYLTGAEHWRRALHPHPHERSRFIPWILRQLEFGGRLELVEEGTSPQLGSGWHLHLSDGYTRGQLLPEIAMPGGPMLFAGDLIPTSHWLDLTVTSGYDRNPESLIGEKERILDYLVSNRGRLFLPRDPQHALVRVMRNRQSRYVSYDHAGHFIHQEA